MVIVKMMRIVVTKAARHRTSHLQLAEAVVPRLQKKKKKKKYRPDNTNKDYSIYLKRF